ncbi:MAG: histidine phosphatase family protein [Gemmataceae bacterium]
MPSPSPISRSPASTRRRWCGRATPPRPIAAQHAMRPVIDPRLIEIDVGLWAGLTWEQVEQPLRARRRRSTTMPSGTATWAAKTCAAPRPGAAVYP